MSNNDVIDIPDPAQSVDLVFEKDRRYFEDHPSAHFYDRSPHPLELWPRIIPMKGWLVRVYQISPGFRIRCPYPEGGQPNERIQAKVKELKLVCIDGKWSTPPRNEGLGDIHIVGVVG